MSPSLRRLPERDALRSLRFVVFTDLRPIDVFAAARRVRGVVRRTPLRRSASLSTATGGGVYLKLETEQITGSFKLRGAFNAIATLPAELRERGVVAASAGNHGLGVAYAAHHFGIAATVFVPTNAPVVKRDGIADLGASIDAEATDYDAALERATAFAQSEGRAFINPCAGDAVLAGQGTVALEIIEELPEVEGVVVPVGGGGLVGGMATLLRALAPHVRIIGAQSENTAAMAQSLRAGRVVPIPHAPTLADGLAGQIDDYALDIGRHAIDDMMTVSEDALAEAIAWLAKQEQVIAEGAGAAAVAAVRAGAARTVSGTLAVVVSGGNIDPARHAAAVARFGSALPA